MVDENANATPDGGLEPNPTPVPDQEPVGIDAPEPVVVEPPAMPEPEMAPPPTPPAPPAAEPPAPPAYEAPAPPDIPPPPAPEAPVPPPPPLGSASGPVPPTAPAPVPGEKNKVVAGILGIALGWLGLHKFYLGYTKEGLIMAGVSVLLFWTGVAGTVVWVIGVVEGIIYLTKTDEEFYTTYVLGSKPWF